MIGVVARSISTNVLFEFIRLTGELLDGGFGELTAGFEDSVPTSGFEGSDPNLPDYLVRKSAAKSAFFV